MSREGGDLAPGGLSRPGGAALHSRAADGRLVSAIHPTAPSPQGAPGKDSLAAWTLPLEQLVHTAHIIRLQGFLK